MNMKTIVISEKAHSMAVLEVERRKKRGIPANVSSVASEAIVMKYEKEA